MFEQSLQVQFNSKGQVYNYTLELVTAIGSEQNIFRLTENNKTILTFKFDENLKYEDCKDELGKSYLVNEWVYTKIGTGNKTIWAIIEKLRSTFEKNTNKKVPIKFMDSDYFCIMLVISIIYDPSHNADLSKHMGQSENARQAMVKVITEKLANSRFKAIIAKDNLLGIEGTFVPKAELKEAVK